MTKFWMVVAAILFGLTTGCPDDGDDCSVDPSLCDPDSDTDSDADADADSDAVEDDGDTSEVASCPTCPDVTGEWDLTYRNTETGGTWSGPLTLEQTGSLVIGLDEYFEYSGTISESGYISLFGDSSSYDRTATGNLTSPSRMEGNWYDTIGGGSGTWWADRQ